jgi:CheY-like chemotaxis protein
MSEQDLPGLNGVPVLIVDDDPASMKLMSVLLTADGCDIRGARSAEEALKVLATFKPRAIVLDLILPLMSGLLLAQILKTNPETRDIVIVAVTVLNGPATARVAREAGCAAYVRKPIDALSFPKVLLGHLEAQPNS